MAAKARPVGLGRGLVPTRIGSGLIPACGDIDSCAHAPCQSKTPISHWTAGRFCDGCLGGGAGGMSQGLRVLVLIIVTVLLWLWLYLSLSWVRQLADSSHSNFANNRFASACDNRRPIICSATFHLPRSSWPSVNSPSSRLASAARI